ncbi:hypothetical protein KP509_22G045100 [Ceratopteris richardii]|nr:hypothetical protein KP509_22G045100 [Ceratopteris richardii]
MPPPSANSYESPLSTMRYFPGDRSKYCYVFDSKDDVKNGSAYLIRASFWAGSSLPYQTHSPQKVNFTLLIYADIWDEVVISLPQRGREETREMFVIALGDHIDVCLAGKSSSSDIPFISSLELRPLSTSMLSIDYMLSLGGRQPMLTTRRLNFGQQSDEYIRYSLSASPFPLAPSLQDLSSNAFMFRIQIHPPCIYKATYSSHSASE